MALTTVDGALLGTNATPQLNGVQFPATQVASANANTLDDYEEGTWTPTVTGDSSNPTVSYSNNQARYTKVGNVVYFSLWIAINTISGGSGSLLIAGLPYVNSSASLDFNPVSGWASGVDWGGVQLAPLMWPGSRIALTGITDNGGYSQSQVSGLAAGDEIRIAGFYYTN